MKGQASSVHSSNFINLQALHNNNKLSIQVASFAHSIIIVQGTYVHTDQCTLDACQHELYLTIFKLLHTPAYSHRDHIHTHIWQ